MDEKFRSRKFLLAALFSVFGSFSLGMGWLDGTQFVYLAGVVLGMYGASNVGWEHFKK